MAPGVRLRGVLPRAALRHLRTKRLRTSKHWTDVWREEHAVAFTVAQTEAQLTVVVEIHHALRQALRKGETLETFRGALEPRLKRIGWTPKGRGGDVPYRLKRIYDTNLRTAHAAGQWDRISRTADLLPYLVYRLGPSEKHREAHEAWAGVCLKVDDPWWNTHYPPNGWGCKCYVQQVAAPPEDSTIKAPEVKTRDWGKDPVTLKPRQVAVGIDPGWDYNVGAHRTLGVNAAFLRRCERAVGTLGDRYVSRVLRRHLAGPGFRWFVERPRAKEKLRWEARPDLIEATPVGLLPSATATVMGVAPGYGRLVRLTEKVMHKQALNHPEFDVEFYALIPEILQAAPVSGTASDTGARWIFDRPVDVLGKRRVVRVVVEVPDVDRRPLIVSVHPVKVKAAAGN